MHRRTALPLPPPYSHSYESLSGSKSTFCRFHPRTVTAIILLVAMFLILCLLHFVISPKYSTVKQNFTKITSGVTTAVSVENLPENVLSSMMTQTNINKDDNDNESSLLLSCLQDQLPLGVNRLLAGVDITKMDFFFNGNTSPYEKQLESIFEFTCNSEKVWNDPRDSFNYSIPDQLTLKFVPGDRFQLRTQFYQNLTQLKTDLAAQYNIEEASLGVGAESASWRALQENVLAAENSILEVSTYYSTLQLHLNFSHSFSKPFISALRELPTKYSEASEKYEAFVDRFGTHYFETAVLGSVYHQWTTVNPEYLYRNNQAEITAKTVANFFARILQKEELVNGSSPTDTFEDQHSYEKNTQSTFCHFDKQSPTLYGGTLKSLDSLVPESNLKEQIKKAIHVRRLKTQLEELKSFLELTGVQLKESEKHLFAHIREFLDEKLYLKFGDLNQVEAKMSEVFKKANEEKDRALLIKYYHKLTTMSDDVLLCKWSLARACHPNQLNVDFDAQNRLDERLRVAYQTLINGPRLPSQSELYSLLNSTVRHISQQMDTKVDICESYITSAEEKSRCWHCLVENVDCWYCQQTACSSPNSWKVIQYQASRRYADSKIFKGDVTQKEGAALQCDCKTIVLSPQPSEKNLN